MENWFPALGFSSAGLSEVILLDNFPMLFITNVTISQQKTQANSRNSRLYLEMSIAKNKLFKQLYISSFLYYVSYANPALVYNSMKWIKKQSIIIIFYIFTIFLPASLLSLSISLSSSAYLNKSKIILRSTSKSMTAWLLIPYVLFSTSWVKQNKWKMLFSHIAGT